MQTLNMESFTAANSRVYESAKALGEINARAGQKLVQKQMDRVSLMWEMGLRQVQLYQEVKGVEDYKNVLDGQAKLAREVAAEVLENVRETVAVLDEAREEVTAWWEKGAEEFSVTVTEQVEDVKPVAPKRKIVAKAEAA